MIFKKLFTVIQAFVLYHIFFGGKDFKKTNIFAFAEELREMLNTDVDAFEICEIDKDTSFYDKLMKEGIKIA